MGSDFLTGLSNQISGQFNLGDNQNKSLDVANDGTAQRYGKLGDFAKKFDQSQERKYLQEGYLRTDYYNAEPKVLEVLFQEPDITVLVKKRAFCALAENFDLSHMDADEKLFYKATKILFSNKCQQIAAYEMLSKIQRVSAAAGNISTQLIPLVISLVNELSSGTSDFTTISPNTVASGTDPTGGGLSKLKSTLTELQNVYSFHDSNFYTTWLVDSSNLFKSKFGQGTGVMEFCNVTNINTTTSLELGGGNVTMDISDPYNMMWINNYDIEKALSDATNPIYNNQVFQFGQDSVDSQAALQTQQLNDARAQRGAGPIQFITNPNSLLSAKVVAIITTIGEQINFTYDAGFGLGELGGGGVTVGQESLVGGPNVFDQGLQPGNEVNLFSQVVNTLYSGIQLKLNSQNITKQNSNVTNYARNKLRLHYNGKSLIQPMDQIHIYIGSKARLDNKIIGGLQGAFTGLGFLQQLSNTAAGFKDSFQALFNPNANANFQLEKTVLVGADFPNWLWTLLRNMFVTETSGVHVFGGVAQQPDSGYNNGSYKLNISGKDMSHYLEQGRVNFKPAASVFNGPLYDPLTPFKTSIDVTTDVTKTNAVDLLDENKQILATNSIKFKAGHLAGRQATESNINQQDSELSNLGQVRKVLYPPDGFVYKWKEGIGTLVQLSDSYNIQGDNTISPQAFTVNPFAGQDIMNIISLSITGIPYNFATYYQANQTSVNGSGRDPQTGEDAAFSYFKSLSLNLQKNNLLWGNFIPFKLLYMGEATFQKVITAQFTINNANSIVNDQLQKIQDLSNQLKLILGRNTGSQTENSAKLQLQNQLQLETDTLRKETQRINAQLTSSGTQGLSIVGNDVSFDTDSLVNAGQSDSQSLSQPWLRKDLRRKTNFLTRRLSWKVRSNEDQNLFIVDDTYDKDYDIQAFESKLEDPKLFESQFASPLENIKTTSSLLNLEVFCDSQGHIRVRAPLYNRMPSSVFYRMFQMKSATGVQVYPDFLETLFITQLQSLQNNLEVIEDQIRLDCALLGIANDSGCYNLVAGLLGGQQNNKSLGEGGQFMFITNEQTGTIKDFNVLYTEANPDKKIDQINNSIEGKLNTQAGINNLFNSVQRSAFILSASSTNQLLSNAAVTNPSTSPVAQDRLNVIQARLFQKTGQQVNIDQFESTNPSLAFTTPSAKVPDLLKITNDVATKLSGRQKLVKQLNNALKNAKESIALDSTTSQDTANKLLFSNISQNTQLPEIFEEMIEDETYDDLGPGSGRRYVIEDHQITSFNIREVAPEFTMITVNGQLDLFLPNEQLPADLNTFEASGSGGGNALVSATAVDYDMWRMYGFKNSSALPAPFLSDPTSQCAPYASMVLSRARKNILQGTLTIAGNEYQQAGDVIYLKCRDLLFYVTSVSHSFSYGNSFNTTLELKYGHSPGDYIPTTLDTIGKLLYNNRHDTSFINYRQNNAYNQQPVGVIILDKRGNDVNTQLLGGTYGVQNTKVVNDILTTVNFAMQSNSDPNTTVNSFIEIRTYFNSDTGSADAVLSSAADTIKQMLSGQNEFQSVTPNPNQGKAVDPSLITVVAVDVAGKTESRSPSQKAVDMVRNILGTSSVSSPSTNSSNLNQTLFGYIIDVWVTFKSLPNDISIA